MAGILGPDGERFIWVMDPMTRKLKVPLSVIDPTQATATPGTVPSLCMLFLDGRCKHPACRQVHISLPVLQQLRRDAQHAPTCCALHGDQKDNSILVSNFSHVSIVNPISNSPIPTPASGNSPIPSSASPAPPPPPPGYPGATAPTARSDSPELSGAMYPPLPSAANEKVSAPSGSTGGASSYAAALLGGGAPTTSPQTSPQAPPSYQQTNSSSRGRSPTPPPPGAASTVLFTIPSRKIAMTVGLQRHLAQSGYLGRSSSTPVESVTPISPPGPGPLHNNHRTSEESSHNDKENATLDIPLKMICRLHLSHKCRYLEDCNNVHICRDLENKLPATTGGAHPTLGPQHCSDVLQSLRPKVTNATVGNTVYSVNVVSTGSISDTDMHQIVQNYKVSNPHVQLRIVDVRHGAQPLAATSTTTPAGHNTSKDSNDDHFHVSSTNEPSSLLPPASSVSPSVFSTSSGRGGHGTLFGPPPTSTSAAPISPLGAHNNAADQHHASAVTSQFAGPGTSPLLQDDGMPPSVAGGLPPPMDALPAHIQAPSTSGGLTTYPQPHGRGGRGGRSHRGSTMPQSTFLPGETQVPGGGFFDDAPPMSGGPTWAYGGNT